MRTIRLQSYGDLLYDFFWVVEDEVGIVYFFFAALILIVSSPTKTPLPCGCQIKQEVPDQDEDRTGADREKEGAKREKER